MVDGLFNQTNYVALKKMLDATALRHEAIASNLANVETPAYRRVDLAPSFASELRSAIEGGKSQSIQSVQPSLAVDSKAVPLSRDGNTVSLEQELTNLSENTLAHNLETQLITGQLLRLRMAITGQNM